MLISAAKPISNMAYYCCGVRMKDAASVHPICGDDYARLFMCDEGMRIYEFFKDEKNANSSMLVRHRIIDDLLRTTLARQPDSLIITIGAGFDTRPFRMDGGSWLEIDETPLVTNKEQSLPAHSCPNPLQRIAIDFASESLENKLAPFHTDGPVTVVVEGVFIYLTEAEIKKMIAALFRFFPNHQLICDLTSREMVLGYGRSLHAKIESMGTRFLPVDQPKNVFTQNGYRVREAISIIERAVDFGVHKVPKMLLRFVFREDVMGNSVYVFEPQNDDNDLII